MDAGRALYAAGFSQYRLCWMSKLPCAREVQNAYGMVRGGECSGTNNDVQGFACQKAQVTQEHPTPALCEGDGDGDGNEAPTSERAEGGREAAAACSGGEQSSGPCRGAAAERSGAEWWNYGGSGGGGGGCAV